MPRRSAHRLSLCFGKLQSLGTTWRDVQASVALLHGYLAVADDSKKSMCDALRPGVKHGKSTATLTGDLGGFSLPSP
jgi:hypothetical protein